MNHIQQQPDPLPRVLARQLDQAARQAVVERDDWRQALDLFEQKLAIWREVGAGSDDDRHELFYALHNVGEVCMRVGDLVRAREVLEEGLKLGEAIGTVRYINPARGARRARSSRGSLRSRGVGPLRVPCRRPRSGRRAGRRLHAGDERRGSCEPRSFRARSSDRRGRREAPGGDRESASADRSEVARCLARAGTAHTGTGSGPDLAAGAPHDAGRSVRARYRGVIRVPIWIPYSTVSAGWNRDFFIERSQES